MVEDVAGKIIAITGANSGIGLATAKRLAAAGAEILMLCRDATRGEAARAEVSAVATGRPPALSLVELDDQSSVRRAADHIAASYDHVDVLINNAGGMVAKRELTRDGIERCFAANHLGPFLITMLLMPLLEKPPAARVVTVASRVHAGDIDLGNLQGEKRYSAMGAYGASKLENILFTYELARRLEGRTVTANCLAPGIVATNFGRSAGGIAGLMPRLLARSPLGVSPEEGARTSVYLASSPEVNGVSGQYFYKCKPAKSKLASYDREFARRLWEVSAALVKADLPAGR